MWRPKLPRHNPDSLLAAGLMVGLPAILLMINGAPILATALGAIAIGGVLLIVHS